MKRRSTGISKSLGFSVGVLIAVFLLVILGIKAAIEISINYKSTLKDKEALKYQMLWKRSLQLYIIRERVRGCLLKPT